MNSQKDSCVIRILSEQHSDVVFKELIHSKISARKVAGIGCDVAAIIADAQADKVADILLSCLDARVCGHVIVIYGLLFDFRKENE